MMERLRQWFGTLLMSSTERQRRARWFASLGATAPPRPAQGGSGTLPPPPKAQPASTLADDHWSLESEVKAQERARERAAPMPAPAVSDGGPPAPVRYDVRPAQGHDGIEWCLYGGVPGRGWSLIARFVREDDAAECRDLLAADRERDARRAELARRPPADVRNMVVDVGDGIGVKARVG